MARGGGTGSRTKQKKKSETPQNGTVNGQTESEQKQMNKLSKHRKQKVKYFFLIYLFLLNCVPEVISVIVVKTTLTDVILSINLYYSGPANM